MKIFCDMHHHMLYYSLQLLLENRLGHELYRPIGEEWFTNGYWKIADIYGGSPETIAQYLQIRHAIPTKMGPRNIVKEELDDYYLIEDKYKDQKALTYAQFMANPPDVVIASYFGDIECYRELAQKVGAKFVVQMGNAWPVDWNTIDNLLASTAKFDVPQGKNAVFYHQEFGLNTFKYEPPQESKYIRSMVHCLPEHEIYKQDWIEFQELEKMLSEYKFESYGISCREGTVQEQEIVAEKMRESLWGFHLKSGGDGYGHVIHTWFATGRPLSYRGSQYAGKLGGQLLEHEVTGLDLDKISLQSVAQKVREYEGNGRYAIMCANVYQKFTDIVDFDKEAEGISNFLTGLK